MTVMQQKRGTLAEWTANSTIVLAEGEIGVEIDTHKAKVGDGTSAWSALPYIGSGGLPSGGTAGQIVAKVDGTDYNATWIDNYTTDLEVYVKNSSGGTFTKGQVVYISGATGANALISLSKADAESTSSKTLGFLKQTLTTGSSGYVIKSGIIAGIDTSGTTEGQAVWLSPTTAGAWTTTKPVAPNHMVYLGVITRSHATQGEINITVQNGYELDELHDILITSKTDGDLLKYDSASGLWKNSAQSTLIITESQVTNLTTDLAGKAALTASQTFTGLQTITPSSTSTAGLRINSLSGQTQDPFGIFDNGGTRRFSISEFGTTTVGSSSNLAARLGVLTVAGTVAVAVRGGSGQTADLQQWQNSAGTILGGRNAVGQTFSGSTSALTASIGGATTAASGDGTTATITTTSATNAAVGDIITVAGVTPTGYNGTYVITAISNTSPFTVSYLNPTTGAQTVAGTVSIPAQASIQIRSNATKGLVIRNAAGQVANPFEIQASNGTSSFLVTPSNDLRASGYGAFGAMGRPSGSYLSASAWNNTDNVLQIRGASNQTGDLAQWQQYTGGTVNGGVNALGQIYSGSTTTVKGGTTAITAATASSTTVATFTFATVSSTNPVAVGQVVTTAGFTAETYFNGNYAVSAIGGSSGAWTFTVTTQIATFTVASATVLGTFVLPTQASITASSAGTKGIIIKGAISQTANLQEWQSSTASVLAKVDAVGNLTAASLVKTGGTSAQFLKADGSVDASTYLTSLGIGTSTQAWDADLDAISALSGTSGFLTKTATNTWALDTNSYLTSFTETDPVFVASAAYSITATDKTNWNTAYTDRNKWDGSALANGGTQATARTSLGLGTMATAASADYAALAGATFTGAVALNGGFSVDSTAFSVADTTGDTTIAGVLTNSTADKYQPSYTIPNTLGTATYIKLGTWTTDQTGRSLVIEVVSKSGYNASFTQNQVTKLHFKTSNGTQNIAIGSSGNITVAGGAFYGDAQAIRDSYIGDTTTSPNNFRIVQLSQTSYEVWGNFGTYTGGSFYNISVPSGTTWVNSSTAGSAPTGTYLDLKPAVLAPSVGYSGSAFGSGKIIMSASVTSAAAPTTRPDGSALTAGDIWISW